jgi:bidirectional [NiFe] hydrogenase diaphorase subunit
MPRPAGPEVGITIDGRHVAAVEGETVLQAARRAGIDIPTLCYVDGLSTHGGCRVCLVEIVGERQLRPACAAAVGPDMEVRTDTATLQEHRRTVIELLFAEGNHVCAVCVANGHCELQDLAVVLGMDHVGLDYRYPARAVDASHPKYVFDANRCVLCTRCVRTCAEIEGASVWEVASRASGSYLVTELHRPWGEAASCTWCGKCVVVCPTGALFYKGRAAGEMVHDVELVTFLATARERGEWIDRGGPA